MIREKYRKAQAKRDRELQRERKLMRHDKNSIYMAQIPVHF